MLETYATYIKVTLLFYNRRSNMAIMRRMFLASCMIAVANEVLGPGKLSFVLI
jgi:hypothetical protein